MWNMNDWRSALDIPTCCFLSVRLVKFTHVRRVGAVIGDSRVNSASTHSGTPAADWGPIAAAVSKESIRINFAAVGAKRAPRKKVATRNYFLWRPDVRAALNMCQLESRVEIKQVFTAVARPFAGNWGVSDERRLFVTSLAFGQLQNNL